MSHAARRGQSRLLIAFLLSFALAACGGGDDGSSRAASDPSAMPLILSSSMPADKAAGVDRPAMPTLTFSAPLDASTAANNVSLTRASQSVSAAVSVSGSTVTITPQGQLRPLTTYTMTAATGLRGTRGEVLSAAASVSFTTRDGAWQSAQLIETDAGEASHPQIAIGANGNALAVWSQFDGTRAHGTRDYIFANRYTAGSGWGMATLVEADIGGEASDPQIAIDANGNAVAVWEQSDGTRISIYANRYTADSGWGTAMLIETDNAGDAYDPQIVIDANGNALAVWSQSDGTTSSLYANRYTAGSGWGTATLIETDNAGNAYSPPIAMDADGNALAVWRQYDGTRYSIYANRYLAGSGWETATLIETDNAGDARAPQIAIDANGNALAVWHQSDGTTSSIYANRYIAGSSWETATLIETGVDSAYEPQIALDPSGNALAVWTQDYSIYANRYTAGSGWGTATLIETDNAGNADSPQIAIDTNGNALAVWNQFDGMHYQHIYANRYIASSGWGTATLIETEDAGNALYPQIAIDSNGNALAVWQQFDARGYVNVYANRYQ